MNLVSDDPALKQRPVVTPRRASRLQAVRRQYARRLARSLAGGPTATQPTERRGLTVLIPAYNEEASIADTIRSVQAQTVPPDEIIVIDDCSKDRTGDVARSLGVTVLRPEKNGGSKALALNHALPHVRSAITLAIDADTVLAPDAIEKLLPAFDDPMVASACGSVIPRHVNTLWERGRYIEYLFAFTLHKPIQDYYDRPLIASGCFSAHRTEALRAHGGWNTRTVAEDMDLTWCIIESGQKVRYVPEAVSYPIEPHNFHFMSKQLSRWCAGFIQCTRVHWKDLLEVPVLRSAVAVGLWDATVASLAFLLVVPLLAIFVSPLFLLIYLLDIPVVLVPVLFKAAGRREIPRALASMPGFFVLRFVNAYFMLRAIWNEWVVRRRMLVFEKGH